MARCILFTVWLMCTLSPATIYATSAQLELTEPVLIPDNRVHGTAFYGALLGSDVYDSAGNLSATFTAGTVQRGHLYFFGDIYTWVRNVRPTQFQPRRVIYTIEPGYFLVRDRDTFRLFMKHQSYHDVDFSDGVNEAYELYGAGWQRAGNPEYSVRIGKYLNERSVDYDWDISGAVTGIVGDSDGRPVYAHLWLHRVEEHGHGDRDGFADYAAECGIRYRSGTSVFARYQLLHDIDAFAGAADHHLMLGVKYSK